MIEDISTQTLKTCSGNISRPVYEIFEEIFGIDNNKDKDGGKVDCEDGIVYSSLQNNLDMDPLLYITWGKHFLLQAL